MGKIESIRLWAWALIVFAFLLMTANSFAQAEEIPSPDDDYRQALALARSGQPEAALPTLEELHLAFPNERRYLYDYITVLGWTEYDAAVLNNVAGLELSSLPIYVLETIGKSARNEKRFALAVDAYRQAYEKQPDSLSIQKGLILSLGENGQTDKALELLADNLKSFDETIDWLKTKAYLLKFKTNSYFDQLKVLDEILAINPNDPYAKHEKIAIASWLGASHVASEMAENNPQLLNAKEKREIKDDAAAFELRWAALPSYTREQRISKTSQSIEYLEKRISHSTDTQEKIGLFRDLLLAQHYAENYQNVVRIYQALKEVDLNDIELTAVGESYLALKEPAIAIALFSNALQKNTNSFDAQIGLVNAYADNNEYQKAIQYSESLVQHYRSIHSKDARDKLSSLVSTQVIIMADAGYYDEARAKLESLSTTAPFNFDILAEIAVLDLWQGFPESAGKRLDYIIANEKLHGDTNVAKLDSLLATQQFEETDGFLKETANGDYTSRQRMDMGSMLRRYNSYSYFVDTQGLSSGGNNGEIADFQLNALLYSKPIKYNYRPFLHSFLASAKITGTQISMWRLGIGMDYRKHRWNFSAEINNELNASIQPGLALQSRYRFNDHWNLSGDIALRSTNISLRAYQFDIYSNSAGVELNYRHDQNRQTGLRLTASQYSDNNLRNSAYAFVRQKLINKPRFTLFSQLDAFASHNTRTQTIYFNPRWDAVASTSFDARWVLYRHYNTSFAHQISPSLGLYKQDNYKLMPTPGLSYQHNFHYKDSFDLSYGVSYMLPSYDGSYEKRLQLFLSLAGNF